MAVKVIIERRIVPGQERRALEVMREMRVRCLDEDGYISGETLRDSNDPHNIVVISSWFGLMDWRRWYGCADRRTFEQLLRPMLSAPERVRVLLEGLSERLSGA